MAKVFDLVDEALHQVALLVQMPVILSGCLAVGSGWNDSHRSHIRDVFDQPGRIIPSVADHVFGMEPGDQLLGLGDVMALTSAKLEAQGVAKTIHAHVDFGAEPASAAPQRLGGLAPLFRVAPAAQGWARTMVLSMIRDSMSGS